MLSACEWNKTELAQRQNYAAGPDVPSAKSGALQRNQDYYNYSEDDMLKKMR